MRYHVFERITAVGAFTLDVLVVDKRRVRPELHDPFEFYSCFAHALLDAVLRRHAGDDERLVVVTDRLPLNRHRKAAEKAFKSAIRNTLHERPFSIVHHPSAAHALLQAVDYCTWAVQRKWHRGDARSYALIEHAIHSVYEAFGVDDDVFSGDTAREEAVAVAIATESEMVLDVAVVGDDDGSDR